jgi:hypothetical protein
MAIGKSGDAATFAIAIDIFIAWCRLSRIAALVTVANTFEAWRSEIVNYAVSGGASNGVAESLNHLLKNQKRQAHGYATWEGFRARCSGLSVRSSTPTPARSFPYDHCNEAREPVEFNLNSRRAPFWTSFPGRCP